MEISGEEEAGDAGERPAPAAARSFAHIGHPFFMAGTGFFFLTSIVA